MPRRFVVMAAIPGAIRRGAILRSAAGYHRYSAATWKWWCAKNEAEFVLLDSPVGGERFGRLPPTFQRWLAPELMVQEYGPDIEIALVDADTMIRWDAPSPFAEAAGRLSAVLDGSVRWMDRSMKAFQRFFPGVQMPWWEAFNSGVVILSGRHAGILRKFVEFSLDRWSELCPVMHAEDVGTDQPVLNFFFKSAGEPVHYLPRTFNLIHCVNLDPFEAILAQSSPEEHARTFSSPWLYDFIDLAYIWHFTNVLDSREIAMAETWTRICHNYDGAAID
jgi:hypothetical protein